MTIARTRGLALGASLALGLSALCVLGLGSIRQPPTEPASPMGSSAFAKPTPATIAHCDVLFVTELLMASPSYAAPRKDEQDRLRARLLPLEVDLEALRSELAKGDPNKPEDQEKARSFQGKQREYAELQREVSQGFDSYVSNQFIESYERVVAAAAQVAEQRGYTHVFAHKAARLSGNEPSRLVAEVLARPIVVKPEGTDISDAVKAALKL
jgi:Skp family chaperone for outer membrane proteins